MLDRFFERVYMWWFKPPGSSVAGRRPPTLTDEQRERIAREAHEFVRSITASWWHVPLTALAVMALVGWLLSLFR